MDATRMDEYNKIKTAVSSGRMDVMEVLWDDLKCTDLHAYFCEELPKLPAVCSRCETLLNVSLQQENTFVLHLLLENGAYPSEDICAAGFAYNHTRSTPLKRAVQSGSLDDVRQLLSEGTDDINSHPRICVKSSPHFDETCAGCDTPLMAAVRRDDIAMMRLLIAYGAIPFEAVHGFYGCREHPSPCTRKTALLAALHTRNKEVVTELVASGADVNQSLGPIGTVLHFVYEQDPVVRILVQFDMDLNATGRDGRTGASLLLSTYYLPSDNGKHFPELQSLLPVMRNLDDLFGIFAKRVRAPFQTDSVTLFLQHGARMQYCTMYLTGLDRWRSLLRRYRMHSDQHRYQHSERFIELLRAADTDFSGVRQRIVSVEREDSKRLNLVVLDQKLSQPLTLQAWCVISVRRQLRSVRDCGMWPRIEKLPLPPVIKDQLMLKIW